MLQRRSQALGTRKYMQEQGLPQPDLRTHLSSSQVQLALYSLSLLGASTLPPWPLG